MVRLRSGVVATAVVLFIAAAASAQTSTPPPDHTPRFDTEVVVTPERGETSRSSVPAATVVLEREALALRPAAYPSEMMAFLPGVRIARSRFDAGRPVVSTRGFFGGGEAEYIVLLVDGLPVADAESGLVDWGTVPTSSIRRIEAVRGPGASFYGDSAVGGVVQIFTDRSARGGQLNASRGTFGTLTADGTWGGQAGSLLYGVSGAARGTGGAYDHSAARHYTGAGRLEGEAGGLSWRWTADGGWRRRDDPGSLSRDAFRRDPYASDPVFRFDEVERRDLSTALTLRHQSPAWLPQARISFAARDEDLMRTILLVPGLGDRRARALGTAAVRASLDGEHGFGSARAVVLRFGADASRERLDTTYRSVSPSGAVQGVNSGVDGHRVRAGLFTASAWDLTGRLRLAAGVRWDTVDDGSFPAAGPDASRAWSPRAGVTLQLNDARTLSLFAQVARAFKAPTLDQRFDPRPYPDFRGGMTFTISNARLVPQHATNVEAGLSGSGAARWSIVAYRADVDNEIDFDVRTFSYANIGESRHTGVEVDAEARWGPLAPSVSYALARVTTAGSGRQLKNIPRHRLRLAASAALPWALSVYGSVDRAGGAFLDDENRLRMRAPKSIDLRIRRAIGRHAAFVDLFNVAGERYEEYGFTLTDFAGRTVPYVYPGPPRAARAGVTIAF